MAVTLVGLAAVAELAGWLGPQGPGPLAATAVALVLSLVLAATVLLPWHRWPDDWQALVPLAFVGPAMLLDYGANLYYVAATPLLWLALFHTRRLLLTGVGLYAAALFLPRILFPELYPLSAFPEVVLVFVLVTVAGLGIQELVIHNREAAAALTAALAREHAAADQLRELDQIKNDFVATVSHDLRTPLTSIIGSTEMLLDGDAGALTAPQRKLLDAADRNARRLDALVGDLLLVSRIESGSLPMHPRTVAVSDLIEGTLEALAARLTGDVQLEVAHPADPVLVEGDPAHLERVTTNLISNALAFTPPGGQVTVAVTADAEQVQLSVADTGVGIPADDLDHVFDRFYRSSRSQQRGRPGTGLGLTIAKSIIEHHGGTIQVGPNPAGGTVFTVTLPRLTSTAGTPHRSQQEQPRPS